MKSSRFCPSPRRYPLPNQRWRKSDHESHKAVPSSPTSVRGQAFSPLEEMTSTAKEEGPLCCTQAALPMPTLLPGLSPRAKPSVPHALSLPLSPRPASPLPEPPSRSSTACEESSRATMSSTLTRLNILLRASQVRWHTHTRDFELAQQ